MRIAYVCYGSLLPADGVTLKIGVQVAAWAAAGHDVEIFALSHSRGAPGLAATRFVFERHVGRALATGRLAKAVRVFSPDLVYLRYDRFLPPLTGISRRFPTVVEMNGNDSQEARLKSWRAALYNGLNRRAILGGARALVCVTHEIATSTAVASYEKPVVVVSNGVDLNALRPLPPCASGRPRLAFIGSRGETWQGIDKLLWLAHELQDVDFELIGYQAADLPAPPPENLSARGRLSRASFEPLLASCDAGIGTLALHRKGLEEACPLKVREYLGYGLPTITAYMDTDFPEETPWFLLRVPNTEDNVRRSAGEIRAFAARVRGWRVPRDAVEHLRGDAKEASRLAFLVRVASGDRLLIESALGARQQPAVVPQKREVAAEEPAASPQETERSRRLARPQTLVDEE